MASTTFKTSALILALLFSGCSIIDTIIKTDSSKNRSGEDNYKKSVSCKSSSDGGPSIAGQSSHTNEQFENFLVQLEKKRIKTTFTEKAAMWSLVQMIVRPDMASPTARFTYGLRNGDSFRYRDFHVEEDSLEERSFPFLYGIQQMLKDDKNSRSLKQIAKIMDSYFPEGVIVGSDLQRFIADNKKDLKTFSQLKSYYFRGKQGLKKNETLKRPSFSKISSLLSKRDKASKYKIDSTLFPFDQKKYNSEIKCNYDLNLYSHNVYLKTPTIVDSVPFMLTEGDNLFMATASQEIGSLFPLSVAPLIAGNSKSGLRSAICHIQSNTNSIDMISTKDRDPAQILYDLMMRSTVTYTQKSLQDAMERGRILYFLNPYRVIIESELMNEEQIEELSSKRIPTYHKYPIGNVFLGLWNRNDLTTTPVLDRRGENQLLCK